VAAVSAPPLRPIWWVIGAVWVGKPVLDVIDK